MRALAKLAAETLVRVACEEAAKALAERLKAWIGGTTK